MISQIKHLKINIFLWLLLKKNYQLKRLIILSEIHGEVKHILSMVSKP